ncbi:MAG: 50S ribosomal protein L2 [Aigarchaeota archaeon]|nr:50S ribosomal protein L2 [Aigarchaeota archaeon]MDW8092465.1 50S ribosomal protein L2 [Nitrososphaerota archaeon]
MPRRTRAQRIGRGSPTYIGSIRRNYEVGYPSSLINSNRLLVSYVQDIVHDPGRGVPVAVLRADGEHYYVPAVVGLRVGQRIEAGEGAKIDPGNIVPLGKVPEGTLVSCVELHPGDGGKLARSSGAYATVSSQLDDRTILMLPSKKVIEVSNRSLAIIGAVSGGGRVDKPFLKAGKKFHFMRAKHRLGSYPRVRGVTMVPARHPFGGGSHKRIGRPETVSRNAPPGQKIGLIAARRTGRRKR